MYTYQADVWCDSCGEAIKERLDAEGKAPADPDDEYTYDSDDYPKYASEGEADSPQFCAAGSECIGRVDLADYVRGAARLPESLRYVGCPMEGLTADGADYLRDLIKSNKRRRDSRARALAKLFARFWGEYLD